MPIVAELIRVLETLAPPGLAADWDNTGLLIGSPDDPANRILTCLTITPEVVTEALAEQVECIVSHHPVLFRGAKNLSTQTAEGRLLLPLLRAGVAVYSPHTSFDDGPGGINDQLAATLGLLNVQPLRSVAGRAAVKLVVFVPDSDLQAVSEAIFQAGGGIIGQYRECSFRLAGTGTFFPTEHTNPTVGQIGRREQAPEWRLEIVVPEGKVEAAVQAMRAAHSYEEPAYDVYPLKPSAIGGQGRVGNLPQPTILGQLARQLAQSLRADAVQIVGRAEQVIRRVAIICGSGGKYYPQALQAGADCFLTGEASFHDCLGAKAAGLAMILPGHYASERPGIEALAQRLAKAFPTATIWPSRQETDVLANVRLDLSN